MVCLSSLGPVPFAVMLLGDLGAQVTRVDRPGRAGSLTGLPLEDDPRTRGHRGIGIDLRSTAGRAVLLRLIAQADVFLEGMRPGAAEKLGIGPDDLLDVNPRLIYGRATGWGQTGPRAAQAGHDINYAGLAGGVFPLGSPDAPPLPPLNLLADFGGGGAYLALGVLAALHQRGQTGQGQVVDAAMVDGVASLTTMLHGMLAAGLWSDRRGDNLLDGAAFFYRTYATADGGFMAVGRPRTAVLPRATRRTRPRSGRVAAARPVPVAGAVPPAGGGLRVPHPRGMGAGLRRPRRLRDAGAVAGRGGDLGRTARARHLRRLGRCAPACPGAPAVRVRRRRAATVAPVRRH